MLNWLVIFSLVEAMQQDVLALNRARYRLTSTLSKALPYDPPPILYLNLTEILSPYLRVVR